MSRKLFAVSAVVLAATVAVAQDPFGGGEKNDHNVGPLGFTASTEGKGLCIRSLVSGGPAERAGLKVGDTLTGVEGRSFDKGDPVVALVNACDAAEGGKKDPSVTVQVEGKGNVKISFPGSGKHTCPKKCEKCKKAVQAGVQFLLSKQAPDGHFPTELGGKTGKVVVTSLSALALMAAGGPDAAIAKATDYVMGKCGVEDSSDMKLGGMGGGGNWNQENWELGYGAIFLAEVAKKTKRGDVKAKLAEIAAKIEKNQESSGGWAHGPGGPNALGYLELEIVGNWALMGLAGAKRNGVAIDNARLEKAVAWIQETSSGDGGVGYSPRSGQKGFGEAGRTSGAIAAFTQLGLARHPFYAKMVDFYRAKAGTLTEGHVSPYMHMTSGAIASYVLGARDWAAYIETYRNQLFAARKADGSFAPIPTKESQALHSNTDATVGPCWTTASAVLILALPNEKVPCLLDKAGSEKASKDKPSKTATGGVDVK